MNAGFYRCGATTYYVATDGAIYKVSAPGLRDGLYAVDALPRGIRGIDPSAMERHRFAALIAFAESSPGEVP